MSELLNGPPLRLGDIDVSLGSGRLEATVVHEDGTVAARVYARDNTVPSITANVLLLIGGARTHRALTALLKASRDLDLGLPGDSADPKELTRRADAENRLDRAEREAAAALAAATPGIVPVGHRDAPESGS